ncbi:uncharacterized protein LOC127094444 [Lathyrus oleraceus]|uniref:uncharacterized protein LOC127094444 n=1 Tax=Pisum sativum TaxID=3888 RepID=UPI0021D15B3B|nr:uncharacterized protein LOC127094444 [Pisum sativum]
MENFDRISHAESMKEACDILVKYYKGGEKVKFVKLQTLQRKYELLQMGKEEKIADYALKVQNLVNFMKAIQESNSLETMKLEGLVGSLEAHEMRIVERKGVQDLIQTLQAQTWKKHSGSKKFKGKGDKTKSFDESKKRKVKLANNSSLQAEGTCDTIIQRINEAKAMIKGVLYVCGMKCNLLSVGQMVEKGFSVLIKDRALELFDT